MAVVRAPVGPDWRADVAALEARVGERTAMLVASAPCFPYLADLAASVADPAARSGGAFYT